MSSNTKKSAFLGMPHGTAVGRLRKQILFMLLQKLNEADCFKCNLPIESPDDLSIEHVLPWEGRSVELFWDLNNITFSHLKCNIRHTKNLPRKCPDGTSWCSKCKTFFPINLFWKNRTTVSGYEKVCKTCSKNRDLRKNHARLIK